MRIPAQHSETVCTSYRLPTEQMPRGSDSRRRISAFSITRSRALAARLARQWLLHHHMQRCRSSWHQQQPAGDFKLANMHEKWYCIRGRNAMLRSSRSGAGFSDIKYILVSMTVMTAFLRCIFGFCRSGSQLPICIAQT
jgi:hypothetical protein